ncbi:MAG: hypothetical protein M1815_004209, partial [Lichina confinis]
MEDVEDEASSAMQQQQQQQQTRGRSRRRRRRQRPCSRSRHGRLDARRLKPEKLKHGSIVCTIVQ